jgi:polar amino acid transport system permease protein
MAIHAGDRAAGAGNDLGARLRAESRTIVQVLAVLAVLAYLLYWRLSTMRYQFHWSTVLTGKYMEWLVSGLEVTLQLSALSIVLSFFLGLVVAVMRMSHARPARYAAHAYLEFFRNTPLLIQIFFWYFGSYEILPQAVNDWLVSVNFEFAAAVIALSIYTSAFIAEDIRSGVLSIPREQMEAARSAGFSYIQSMRYIILPQAVRITIPPLINQFLNLAKNSSLAMTIGVAELTYQARQVESYTFRGFEAFSAATIIYVVFSLAITLLVTFYGRRVLSQMRAR